MENATTLASKALKLKPAEKLIIIEALIKSLDKPDNEIEEAWANEAESRLKAYKEGKLEAISLEDMF